MLFFLLHFSEVQTLIIQLSIYLEMLNQDPCLGNLCENTAECKVDGESYLCFCQEGFEGRYCQGDIIVYYKFMLN